MYFVNRIDLGRSMAQKVAHLKSQGVIILCLKEDALSTSIGLASELRGRIYPLLIEPIIIPGDPRIIGAINQDGELCHNPELSTYEREELEMEYSGIIQDASREAFSRLNQHTNDYGSLSKESLQGRTVILCADIIRDQIEIGAAIEFLKPIKTQSVISIVGNITNSAADMMTIATEKSDFLDVMAHMMDDDHYFEQPEAYSVEERRRLAMNISQYWV